MSSSLAASLRKSFPLGNTRIERRRETENLDANAIIEVHLVIDVGLGLSLIIDDSEWIIASDIYA